MQVASPNTHPCPLLHKNKLKLEFTRIVSVLDKTLMWIRLYFKMLVKVMANLL